jgi:hypothetical protein
MAAHATPEHTTPEPTAGVALLPTFALAIVAAVIAIGFVIASPSLVTLVIAMAAVLGFAVGIVVLLGRLIGPEQH